jgi:hypothetical protein
MIDYNKIKQSVLLYYYHKKMYFKLYISHVLPTYSIYSAS